MSGDDEKFDPYTTFEKYDASTGGLMMRTPLLLKELCRRAAMLQPDEQVWTRISDGYHKITWREVESRAKKLASALSKHGIKFSDRVATFEFNTARHLEMYYGIPCMGAVLHPLNIRLHKEEIAFIIDDAQDKVLFVGQDFVPALAVIEKEFPDKFSPELIVVCGADEKPLPKDFESPFKCKCVSYEDFIKDGDENFKFPDFDENAAMGLCYTSGTTGKPKGVLYSHRSTYLHTLVLCQKDQMGTGGTDSCLPIVPQYHVLSWGQPYVAMMTGHRYCQFNKYAKPDDVLRFLIDAEVTFSCGVPTIWQEVRKELTRNPARYRGKLKLKAIVSGGSAPPSEMMVWYSKNWNVEFKHAWGMTETNPIGTISNKYGKRKHLLETEDQLASHVRKMGLFCPGLTAKIVDPSDLDKELPWDGEHPGELLIRGPWICGSYWKNRGQDKFHKGYLITGDIATIDEEGYMVLRDRSKDLVKSGGEWISSIDMENSITAVEGVSKACVVGVPHPKWDERPICILVIDDDQKDKEPATWLEKVRKHLSSKFAKFQLPDDALLWDAIPETSTRKMDKKTVRKKLLDDGYRHPKVSEEDQKIMMAAFEEQKAADAAAEAAEKKRLAAQKQPPQESWDAFPVWKEPKAPAKAAPTAPSPGTQAGAGGIVNTPMPPVSDEREEGACGMQQSCNAL